MRAPATCHQCNGIPVRRMHAHSPACLAQRTHIPGMRPATSGAPGGRLLARGGHLGRENGAHHTRARGVARCVQKDGQQSTWGKGARLHRGRGNDQDAKHGGGLVFLTGKISGFRLSKASSLGRKNACGCLHGARREVRPPLAPDLVLGPRDPICVSGAVLCCGSALLCPCCVHGAKERLASVEAAGCLRVFRR